jgi:type IV pilus assembly protein PilN
MIKINLLPVKRKKKPKPVPPFLIAGTFLLIFTLIGAFYARYFLSDEVSDLETKKNENTIRLKNLNEKIKEVKDFESLNIVFTERKEIIEQLYTFQSLPAKILDEMSMRLTEGVWFTSMDISRDSINISGVGFSTTDIVTYVQTLKGSEMLKNVVLKETSASKSGDMETFTYTISMSLN